MLTRRTALGGLAGAALVQPVTAGREATLRFVPSSDLPALDPIWTTAYVVRNHGYMVFDTLYATDSAFRVRPQMAEGHEVEDDGRSWTIRLRDGLRFHDGAPVLARDCVASIRRWAQRNAFGQTLMAQTDALASTGDRTLRFRLKAPFPMLVQALGTASSPVPFMMPERLAQTDPAQQFREAVGSGPFRFLPDEWVQGSSAAWSRFDGYVPREEPADGAAGGKVVHVDRVEWHTIPDPATAMAAMQTGQMDWLEAPAPDLLPLVASRPDFTLATFDPVGSCVLMRFNGLHPPFDDVAVRRAVLLAVNQTDHLQAMVGSPSRYRACRDFFPCGTPLATEAGAAMGRLDEARALLRASRYDGQVAVILSPADLAPLAALAAVSADVLTQLGMRVEVATSDWASLLTRRASQEPPERGGWSVFHAVAASAEFTSPASHFGLRGNGRAGWAGWHTDPTLERLRSEWFAASDDKSRTRLAAAMDAAAFESVPYVPLGQMRQQTLIRSDIGGMVAGGGPFFWGLQKH